MRVLVIPEKVATPKTHQYKFTKIDDNELAPGGTPFEWSKTTLPRFGSAHALSLQAIYE